MFIPLDNFRRILHNKGIRNKLDAWLTFLSVDDPEMIVELIRKYPQFRKYYEEIYQLCRNTEKVMNMFSKELQELDKNTVQYMIDEMQDVIDEQKKDLDKKQDVIDEQKKDLDKKQDVINEQKENLGEMQDMIDEQKRLLGEKESALADKEKEIAELKARLGEKPTSDSV